ncbi:MAG: PilZ domain-containing protein [Candidatus Omnitrophica bacterium]|nr:PilZ domain-containing protein [Candidatus Omnitrophota bacterium]
MGKWEGLNRRRFPRVKYPCLIVLHASDNHDVILTHTENVGVGGICVILKKEVPLFTEVELELDLLDLGNNIRCKGKVVWMVQRSSKEAKKPLFYDIGVEFESVDEGEYQRLDSLVKKLASREE